MYCERTATARTVLRHRDPHSLLPANYVWTTYAYAVSLAAAERLLGGIAPVDKPVDHHFVLASACGAVNAFACDPQLVDLAPHFEDSTVGGW